MITRLLPRQWARPARSCEPRSTPSRVRAGWEQAARAVDQHVDRPAAREHGRRERAYLDGVAHVRAQELRRTAGTADRLDRRRPRAWLCPTTRISAPSRASSMAAKRPIPREAPVNSTVFPCMLQSAAAS